MKAKRKIACMTGTRADYPRVKSVLSEICKRDSLELNLIVTGSHLLDGFGNSQSEIEKDGFDISAHFDIYADDDSPYGMAKAAAKCADGMADALNKINPDIVLLTVDRMETMAAAQTSALMNYPIAHIQGGEVTGTIDESIRHAVTKLSHIHFPATPDAAERILKMGENPINIHTVGCPYIDVISNLDFLTKENLAKKYNFNPSRPLVLFTQHPVTTEYGQGSNQINVTINALKLFPEFEILALYSNPDAGGREIINLMKEQSNFHTFPNIHSEDFLGLMKCASLMIGNSSAGIREAPSFKLPCVNIGSRQQGRLRADNVIDVPHNLKSITQAIKRVFDDSDYKKRLESVINPYGDGKSAKRIVDILENIDLSKPLIQKLITY